jgi:hypothetical protein
MLSNIQAAIAGFIILAAAFIATFFKGKKQAELEAMQKTFKSASEAKKAHEKNISNTDIDDKLERLHESG